MWSFYMDEENIHHSEIIPATKYCCIQMLVEHIVIQKITLVHQFKATFPKH